MPKEKLPVVSNYIVIDNETHQSLYKRLVGNYSDRNKDDVEVVVCRKLQDDELERAFVRRETGIESLEDVVNYIQEKKPQGYEINILYIDRIVLDSIKADKEEYRDSNGRYIDAYKYIIIKLLLESFPNIKIRLFSGGGLAHILDPLKREEIDKKTVCEVSLRKIRRTFQDKDLNWSLCDDE